MPHLALHLVAQRGESGLGMGMGAGSVVARGPGSRRSLAGQWPRPWIAWPSFACCSCSSFCCFPWAGKNIKKKREREGARKGFTSGPLSRRDSFGGGCCRLAACCTTCLMVRRGSSGVYALWCCWWRVATGMPTPEAERHPLGNAQRRAKSRRPRCHAVATNTISSRQRLRLVRARMRQGSISGLAADMATPRHTVPVGKRVHTPTASL
jgi:hypothetical protein